ncbi:phosphoethanolamine transferase [Halodesulfovibrio marinisediminis]|uniref:Phosphoethanolamine transferase for glucans (OPG), alkaline phosphatase superfamily n=1 Tax=Halodesulfovibrio marinisediminis DSM 17456 TaxID=1121457 RepID=A0A1N6II18_9BACT|nr:phosphoethanolamine transferase [Halodesulfovibrio marinisediminis]SIO31674.1 Phosphoethanolamine transferase for glucans (OPG), alkaline phosphatase superfamily [Halodesulfovibrio marinisediminis DSM 17456]
MFALDKKHLASALTVAFSALMLPDLIRLPAVYAIPSAIYLFLFNFCVMYAACQLQKVTYILIPPIFFISALASYFRGTYRVKIDRELIFLLLETNRGEAGEIITSKVVLFGIAALLVALIFGFLLKHAKGKFQLKPLAITLLFVVPTTVFLGKFKKDPQVRLIRPAVATKRVLPYCIFNAFGQFSKFHVQNIIKGKPVDSAKLESVAITPTEPLTVITIIGESARADRFQINGYQRETTPLLNKENNLVNFGAIKSFSAYTRLSVPAMITPATLARPETTMTSFLGVFKKHGFKTTWLSANDRTDSHNTPTTNAIGDIDQKLFRNRFCKVSYGQFYDEMLLPPLKKVLESTSSSQAITIHTRGSHASYNARYTKEFAKFTPDDYEQGVYSDGLENAYDNSILATDSFIVSVINLVRDKNAVVIYSSDHGESLGEDGRFMHGNPAIKEQREVPFLVWFSDTYAKLYPHTVTALRKQQGAHLSHDVFFPWTVNLGGILLPNSSQPVLLSSSPMQAHLTEQ